MNASKATKMTLHEAMVKVLREKKRALPSREIADEINRKRLYIKRDKTAVSSSQICARMNKYRNLLERKGSLIALR